ncbi:zinc finger protein, partial [Oryctes borbonicus]
MAVEYTSHEYTSNNYEKYDKKGDIKLEDFIVQRGEAFESKARVSLISDDNLVQDVLLENIKVENSNEQLTNDTGYTVGLEKIETIKVEKCIENGNVLMLQHDPLSEGSQSHVKLEINKQRNVLYHCDICGKGFPKPYLIRIHKIAHSESRPYSCEVCGKCFKTKNSIRIHHFVHSGKRPYPCDQCDKSFQTNNKLKAHKECHVSCEQCGKVFKGQRSLQV